MKTRFKEHVLWLGSAIAVAALAIIFFTDRLEIYVLAAFVFGIVVTLGSLSVLAGMRKYGGRAPEKDHRVLPDELLGHRRDAAVHCALFVLF